MSRFGLNAWVHPVAGISYLIEARNPLGANNSLVQIEVEEGAE